MPRSVNGFGTGLCRASRRRVVSGGEHYDAIEAVTAVWCPLIPYRVIHVIAQTYDWRRPGESTYRFIPLRFSWSTICRASFHAWGGFLSILGIGGTILFSIASFNMEREFTSTDAAFIAAFAAAGMIGVLLRIVSWVLSRRSERIKDLLGPHECGFSDPFEWADEIANDVLTRLQMTEAELLERAYHLAEHAPAEAGWYLRLNQRIRNTPAADNLLETLLSARTWHQ
ncbi:MAG: hypothetical protein KDA96_09645 [Planctomycetaceae bacterium]|nr:hypothetical protein [Planctomycetaceae bacterium]MCA9063312.1 hypothetical protein [Planctomycetaceae bacterium]